jgi:hypothetical protein
MSAAAIAWIVVGSLAVLAIVVSVLANLPELRRYLRIHKM